ncbi:hypothetical protein AX17_007145 [Amanita inopinata Kibby_2008]|nr:hypothetical protein AX17_007145 [Amanita inopinata Kibby_2008]
MRLSVATVTTALVLAGLSSAIPITKQNTPVDLVARYEDLDVREMDFDELYSRSFDDEPELYSRNHIPTAVSSGVTKTSPGVNVGPSILVLKSRSRHSAVDLYARGPCHSQPDLPEHRRAGPDAPIKKLVDTRHGICDQTLHYSGNHTQPTQGGNTSNRGGQGGQGSSGQSRRSRRAFDDWE